MKHTLALLLSALLLGGCVATAHHGSVPSPSATHSAPGEILYGQDVVIECRYNHGCRSIRQ
ncbi:MAG: hypothetical protein Q4A06_01820 [Cardiobacteriaceae bacterium]|nr:hypothetical protein [Cardiobacteriaceae bacterium]